MSLIELKAKLLRTEDWRAINGAAVVKRYHNPDGPEAVAQLEAMQAEIDRYREALRRIGCPEDTERSLMPSEMRMIARASIHGQEQ